MALVTIVPEIRAQRTAVVTASNPIYTDIERLSELGLLDSVIIGQRPYSIREIARISHAARARLQQREAQTPAASSAERTLVDRVSAEVAELEAQQGFETLLTGWSLTASSTDADRRLFSRYQNKPAEATIDPLAERRLGTPAAKGQSLWLEAEHRLEPTSWAAFQLRERVDYGVHTPGNGRDATAELLIAAARLRYHNVAFSAGRQQFTWAQSAGDGLFLASDAPALDQISLSGDQPFVLPGFLHYLGPTQATLVIADLGPSIIRSHSELLTYKVSVQPSSAVEIGGTFMDHYGGEGGLTTPFSNRLIDFLPFLDVFRTHNYYDSTKTLDVDSDKLLGVDGRMRLDAIGGVLLTGELLIDDFDPRRVRQLLTSTGSQMATIIIPRLGTPAASLKLSAKHMGIITYTHLRIENGITTRGRLLGDELGPDAKSYSATLRVDPTPLLHLELEGRSSIYSDAVYAGFYTDPAQTIWVVQKVAERPDELRDLAIGKVFVRLGENYAINARAGLERTRNVYGTGGRRSDYVIALALRAGI